MDSFFRLESILFGSLRGNVIPLPRLSFTADKAPPDNVICDLLLFNQRCSLVTIYFVGEVDGCSSDLRRLLLLGVTEDY